MNVKDSVVIVTGGASGLGEATARRFVGHGAKAVIADLNEDRGTQLAAELGDGAVFSRCDVTDPAQIEAAIDKAKGLGTLRIAVSCAGVGWAARTVDRSGKPHDLDLYKKVIGVNQIGTFNTLRMSAAAMMQNEPTDQGERGVIINTASVAAFDGQIGQIAYAASKAAVAGMTLPAARDLSKAAIRVVTIAPGVFDTPMMSILPDEAKAHLSSQVVFPKTLGDPDWYAQLAEAVAENPYLNGETIRLDGALRMPPK